MKQIFERAIDNVGFTHVHAAELWSRYIDFETLRNNLTIVNLLCHLSLEQPMSGLEMLSQKYEGILQNLFKDIQESFSDIAQTQLVPNKYKDK